ncbi:hypothetical protein R6Q57_018933 [Mikania cordata]
MTRYDSNITSTPPAPLEVQSRSQSQSERHAQYGKQSYGQYSGNSFSTLAAASPSNGDGLSGPMSQPNDQICGAYSWSNGNCQLPVQMNKETHRSDPKLKMGSGDIYLPGGFIANYDYDLLDDLMSGMMKQV